MWLLVPHPSLKLQFRFFFFFFKSSFTFSHADVYCSLPAQEQPQFHILRKLSQDPVQHAMPSEDTPIQLTLLS